MAFFDCYKIIGGALMGDMIASVSSFPQQQYISSSEHRSLDQTQWLVNSQWTAFNNEYNKMLDVLGLLRDIGIDQTRVLAVLPIYAGVGIARTQTGTFSISATRKNYSNDYYEFYGHVKDINGNELGGYWGNATGIFQEGGSWDTDSSYRANLALCQWSNGLGANYIGLYIQMQEKSNVPYNNEYGSYYFAGGACIRLDTLYTQFGIHGDSIGDPISFSPNFGPASEPDGGYNDAPDSGYGTFDDSSDEIGLDTKPLYGVTSVGFINVYKIEQNELINLGEKLFPHFLPAEILADPSQLTVQEVLTWFIKMAYGTMLSPTGTSIDLTDNLGIFDILMNGKLIDYVLDCHVIPTSISGATVSPLKIGYRTFNDFQLAKATEDYVDVDCGELYIKEFYGNFLDYSGNLKVELYLPMIGFVPIDNEFWNNATIKVIYRFNIIDGSFQAKVFTTREDNKSKISNSLIAQYGGVCCVHFPITGLQYSNVISGLVNGGAGAVANKANGNVAGAVSNVFNMAMLRPDNPSSNGYNASSSFLSHRTPYLVIKMPVAQFSKNYPKEIGLPLNVTYQLSQIHGFTVIDNPVLNIQCSDEEYTEICSLLKSGVIF